MLSTDDIDRVSFTQVRFREGYDIDEVDAFVAAIRASIAAGPSAAGALGSVGVSSARFQPTKFRPGYDQNEVDALLAQAEETLRAFGR
jgi:DivIVA domain-containing protein